MLISHSLYFLTKYPTCYQKLQKLVKAEFPGGENDWTYERAKTIAYIDFIVQETLRLKPSIPAGLARLTPADGLQIDEITIPGDTIVSVPAHTIHRDERYWKNALEFIPERWEDLSPDKTPWIPFTRGQLSCPGKNLAFMELRMVLSRIALRYDVSFAEGFDEVEFDQGAKDTFTLNVTSLPLVFTVKA
jgi:cytochrome P450